MGGNPSSLNTSLVFIFILFLFLIFFYLLLCFSFTYLCLIQWSRFPHKFGGRNVCFALHKLARTSLYLQTRGVSLTSPLFLFLTLSTMFILSLGVRVSFMFYFIFTIEKKKCLFCIVFLSLIIKHKSYDDIVCFRVKS